MGAGDHVSSGISNASAYFCRKCRHVELFLSETEIQAMDTREKNETAHNNRVREYMMKKEMLLQRLERLQRIISDENQTVKAVNDAKEEIQYVQAELSGLVEPRDPNSFQYS